MYMYELLNKINATYMSVFTFHVVLQNHLLVTTDGWYKCTCVHVRIHLCTLECVCVGLYCVCACSTYVCIYMYVIVMNPCTCVCRQQAGRPACPIDPYFIVPDKCKCVDFQARNHYTLCFNLY